MIKPVKLASPLFGLLVSFALISCETAGRENKDAKETIAQNESPQTKQSGNVESSQGFAITNIPVSNYELGTFPFITVPKGLSEQNKPVQRKFDRVFFAINGKMTPLEGQVWKSNIVTAPGNAEEWSLPYFEKNYEEAITSVGGVKIFDGEITQSEYERYHSQAAYLGEDGSIGYTGENIKVFVIRRADGKDIYIQMAGYSAGGKIDILQVSPK